MLKYLMDSATCNVCASKKDVSPLIKKYKYIMLNIIIFFFFKKNARGLWGTGSHPKPMGLAECGARPPLAHETSEFIFIR
jgi:hypothetical protein